MHGAKKAFNILGILVAWILSISLVLMLIVTPIVFSALSLLSGETITKILTGTLTQSGNSDSTASSQEVGGKVVTLSSGGETNGGDLSSGTTGSVDISQVDPGILEGIVGDALDQETLDMIMSSKVVNELLEAYTEDFMNSLDGTPSQFNAEKITQIINDNMDETVDILKKVSPEFAEMDTAEIAEMLQKAVDEYAGEIVQALPKPEDIKQEIVEGNAELALAFDILAQRNTIKLIIIGAIVLLSVLIFVCRLFGMKGFRWLATDLFIGSGFNGLLCAALFVGGPIITEMAAAEPAVGGLVATLLSAFTGGMLCRTAVMLGSAVILLVLHILIKKARAKKAARQTLPEIQE